MKRSHYGRRYAEIRSKKMAGDGPAAENTISEGLLSLSGSCSDRSDCRGSISDHVAKPRTENLLYAAVIDESLDEKKLAQATADMGELLGADGKRKTVQIDDSFYIRDGALDKLQVYLHNQQIDVVILDRELFEEYAGYGYFESLDEVTGEKIRRSLCVCSRL